MIHANTPLQIPKLGKLTPKRRAPRMVLIAEPGFGKTTIAAYAGGALIMVEGETGYETLLGEGRVPSVDAVCVESWPATLALLDSLIAAESLDYPYITLDALGGFQQLCFNPVCERDCKGECGKEGFAAFGRGPDLAGTEWLQLLQRLERLHRRDVGVILLSHSRIKKYRNPLGEDFDKYMSDVHEKIWAPTQKWADTVLFGKFLAIPSTDSSNRTRGIGGTERVIYTQQCDAYDAKNRYGMPPSISLPDDPALGWKTINQAITG